MNRRIALSILIAVVIIFAAPLSVHAAGLIPCGADGEPPCQLCNLVDLGQNLINFGILAAVLVSSLMFAYAGILYVTAAADQGQIKKAHGIFTKVFIGFVVVLGAWLIVDTVMRSFVSNGSVFGAPWNNIQCVQQPQASAAGALPDFTTVTTPDGQLHTVYQCPGCTHITSFQCGNMNSCLASPTFNQTLQDTSKNLGDTAGQYRVTEAGGEQTPPHIAQSEYATGDTADVARIDKNYTVDNVKQFLSACAGRCVFETSDTALYNSLKQAGVSSTNVKNFPETGTSGCVPKSPCITGSHYSVYNN